MRRLLPGLIAAIAAPACANAAPPSGLYGKSVIVSWTETRSQRNPGDQAFRPMSIPVESTKPMEPEVESAWQPALAKGR